MRSTLITWGVVWLSAGCGDARELREWTPADHPRPQGADELDRLPEDDAPRPDPEVTLFNLQCASCHGRSGRGDGPSRPPMSQPPDFTSPEWQRSMSDAQLRSAIVQGKGMMPGFGDKLLPSAIDRLVTYLRRLGPTAPPATSIPDSSGDLVAPAPDGH
jgi:cytochrome c oxidase cbb3-type subunit 3